MYVRTIALLLTTFTSALLAQAPPDARASYDTLAKDTQLTSEGKAPFHISIDAQLFDLEGKPSEKATIEEWWASSKQYRTEIKSASAQVTLSSLDPTEVTVMQRNAYLLRELLQQALRPVPELRSQTDTIVKESDRTVGGVSMHCLQSQYAKSPAGNVAQSYCVDGNGVLRAHMSDHEAIIRNRTGHFRDASVALQISIAYLSRVAITGDVKVLQSFDPAQSSLAEFAPNAALSSEASTDAAPQPSGVVPGHKVSGDPPQYPVVARQQGRTGTILICALIGTNGKITSAEILAGSDPSLNQASLEAVHSWRYTPYLLNGKPTSVQTTITLNFNIGS